MCGWPAETLDATAQLTLQSISGISSLSEVTAVEAVAESLTDTGGSFIFTASFGQDLVALADAHVTGTGCSGSITIDETVTGASITLPSPQIYVAASISISEDASGVVTVESLEVSGIELESSIYEIPSGGIQVTGVSARRLAVAELGNSSAVSAAALVQFEESYDDEEFLLEEDGDFQEQELGDHAFEQDQRVRSLTEKCNTKIKQKAIYSFPKHSPTLASDPAIDMIGDVYWTDLDDLYAKGKNGLYHAFMLKYGRGNQGGYFGPQAAAKRNPDTQQVLFSLWDQKRYGDAGWRPAIPVIGDGIADCTEVSLAELRANPGQACCKRNCNDCAVHGDFSHSTGTQCKTFLPARTGKKYRMRIRCIAVDQTIHYYQDWQGDIWEVSIQDMTTGEHSLVGRQLIAGTVDSGITKMSQFYEHLGCTLCDNFYAETHRAGPWVLKTKSGADATALVSATSTFKLKDPPYTCKKHSVDGAAEMPGSSLIQYKSGPGVEEASGDGTWRKTLYDCGGAVCTTPTGSAGPITLTTLGESLEVWIFNSLLDKAETSAVVAVNAALDGLFPMALTTAG